MKIFDSVKRKIGEVGFEISRQKPEILIGIGISTAVVGCVLACRATLKADDILKNSKKEIEKIEEVAETYPNEYSDETKKKDLTIIRTRCIVNIGKEYIPAIALGIFAVGCIYNSHTEMKARGAALAAAYNVLNDGFKFYRKNVVEEYGEEVDKKMFYGIQKKNVEVSEFDKDGNEIISAKEMNTMESVNPCAFIFARETSKAWTNDQTMNLSFVESTLKWAQVELDLRMHEAEKKYGDPKKAKLLLTEVLDQLEMDRTDISCVDGWHGGSIIDFRICDIYKEAIHQGANQRLLEPAIALNFNCDGVVIEDLPSNKRHIKLIKNYGKNA